MKGICNNNKIVVPLTIQCTVFGQQEQKSGIRKELEFFVKEDNTTITGDLSQK